MKLAYARFMQQMTTTAMHLQGAARRCSTTPTLLPRGGVWTTKFLHSPSLRIAGGSDQIQGNIIGERVLGLPAEARADRDIAVPRPGQGRSVGSAPMATAAMPSPRARRPGASACCVAALELGADGGYEAVQMRDVAASRRGRARHDLPLLPVEGRAARRRHGRVDGGPRAPGHASGRRGATPPPSACTTCCAAPSPRWSASPSWRRR